MNTEATPKREMTIRALEAHAEHMRKLAAHYMKALEEVILSRHFDAASGIAARALGSNPTPPEQPEPFAWYWFDDLGCLYITGDDRRADLPEKAKPLYEHPAPPPPQTHVKAVPHEPTPEMLAAAMKADQDGMPATMKTIWMVMWGAYAPPPQTNVTGSGEPENRFEGYGPEHGTVLRGDLEGLPIYDVVGQNLLSDHLSSGLHGLLVGSVERGELSSFRILFEDARLSNVEVVPGHVISIIYPGPNQTEQAPFPAPEKHVAGRWLPIEQADKTINHVTEFTQIGLTLKNSDTFWVRDEDGRVYEAAWSEGNNGRDYWWDWAGESPVDPIEFMPHPLDPRWSATTEGK